MRFHRFLPAVILVSAGLLAPAAATADVPRAALSARRSLAAKSAAVQPLTGIGAASSAVSPPSAGPVPDGAGQEQEARARRREQTGVEGNRMGLSLKEGRECEAAGSSRQPTSNYEDRLPGCSVHSSIHVLRLGDAERRAAVGAA